MHTRAVVGRASTLRVLALFGPLAVAACGGSGAMPGGGPPADAGVADAAADRAPEAAAACAITEPASRWARWPMPHPAGSGYPNPHSYDLGTPGVVVDRVTGLVWERAVDGGTYRWDEANARCACLSLGGHDDWRLPTRIELVSIVDFTRSAPAIDPVAFPATPVEWFWTSSRWAEDPAGFAWYLYFETGFANFGEQAARYRVRCLRDPGGSAPDGHYQVGGDTVRDLATGLTWARPVDGTMRAQADARAACAALPLAGAGWRLPSMKELQTLVDEDRASPSIDPTVFPDVPAEPFWTGTPVAGIPGSAWRVSFVHGYTYDAKDSFLYFARCVR